MKTIIRFLSSILLTLAIATGLTVQMPEVALAKSAYVYEYSDMIGQGGYIYYIRTSEKNSSATIMRMKVSGGETSKVVSEPGGIQKLIVSGRQLYYVTANDDSQWEVRTCPLNGGTVQKVCEGFVCYADSENVYVTRYADSKAYLYMKNLASGEETLIKAMNEGQTLDYVCNIGSVSYYYVYDETVDKLTLYCLQKTSAKKKLTRVAVEKRVVKDSRAALQVSDIRQMNQELYYNFGSYEGSGNFWNGTIRKLTVDGKKKTVARYAGENMIAAGSRELYYKDMKGNDYKYHLKTGKNTKYSLRLEANIDYTVLGDKTYMADASNRKKIVISRFNSGTDRETLAKNFISIPFKQAKNISYSVKMKQVGIYMAICVTGTDFSDMSYGWRGKLVSMNWYIADGAGTVLGSFE